MFNHSSSQLDEVALWPVTKNHRLPFGSDKTNLTVTQMLACVDDYDYDGYAVVMLMLMLLVMLMLVMMLTMAHRLPANDRSSLTVTHSLTFVTAARAIVGLLTR